jgi:hypothetical protein
MTAKSAAFAFALLALAAAFGAVAFPDAGVFTGNGQNLHQISTKEVQLVSIDVTIVPGRGRFLFDGSVPGMDQTEFHCTFVLKNLSPKVEEVQIGFPVDSEFARHSRGESPTISLKESDRWISDYSFIARDERSTYHVSFVRRKKMAADEFSELFTWKMSFLPKETRTLTVQYQIPTTMGLTSTRRDENADYQLSDPLEQELLNIGMEEIVGYITSTGASWAGDVKSATFTVITAPFERYLDVRGIGEEPPLVPGDKQDKGEEMDRKMFPVQHPWWFRTVSPGGWKNVENGIQWHYEDYKPHDPIVVSYIMTEFPRLPSEASAFVSKFLENLSDSDSALSARQQLEFLLKPPSEGHHRRSSIPDVVALQQLKELLLATYGREPDDESVKRHVASQVWYQPQANFSIDNLTMTQKAILNEIDARIEMAKEAQSRSKN